MEKIRREREGKRKKGKGREENEREGKKREGKGEVKRISRKRREG